MIFNLYFIKLTGVIESLQISICLSFIHREHGLAASHPFLACLQGSQAQAVVLRDVLLGTEREKDMAISEMP